MKVRNTVFDIAVLLATVQWAFSLGALGYAKFGLIGAVVAFVVSPAVFPFSPLSAWLFMPSSQMVWFYGFLSVALISIVISSLARTKIIDENGREL